MINCSKIFLFRHNIKIFKIFGIDKFSKIWKNIIISDLIETFYIPNFTYTDYPSVDIVYPSKVKLA